MRPSGRKGLSAAVLLLAALLAPLPIHAAEDAARAALLAQAAFWHGHAQDDQALAALDRLLAADPNDADALVLAARIHADRDEKAPSLAALARLRAAHPDDPRAADIARMLDIGKIDAGALAEARRLAAAGHHDAAIARYRAILRGKAPPSGLAVEYYQTLAGTADGWPAARDELATLLRAAPDNLAAQLAYAEILSYREATRAAGIARLASLAGDLATAIPATAAWRQALLWLPATPASLPMLQAYLDAHPDDDAVRRLREAAAAPPSDPRSEGFRLLAAGHAEAAARRFAAVLAAEPDDAEALGGLGLARLRAGNTEAARAALSRAIALDPAHRQRWQAALDGATATLASRRARQLRAAAARETDPARRVARYREALAASPDDPWLRLDLARALRADGQEDTAASLMAALTADPHAGSAALRAGIVFAAETDRTEAADALIARLPAALLTPDMRRITATATLARGLAEAARLPRDAARTELLSLADAPDPDGTRGPAIAHALLHRGDRDGARAAIAAAIAATPDPGPSARIADAGALLAAADDQGATALLATLDPAMPLAAKLAAEAASVRAGLAVRAADRLDREGDPTAALALLAPALAADPASADLHLARGRAEQAADRPRVALAEAMSVLHRDPGNAAARHEAVDAALALGDRRGAAVLLDAAPVGTQDDPQFWLADADLARARTDWGQAMDDLRHARALTRPDQDAADAGTAPASFETAQAVTDSPFRNDAVSAGTIGATIEPATLLDPANAGIDRAIEAVGNALYPSFEGDASVRVRSGTEGLDQLTEFATPMEANYSPDGHGTLRVLVQPTVLDAGSLAADPLSQARYGTQALALVPPASGHGAATFAAAPVTSQTAAGVAGDILYAYDWVSIDLGSTPTGFPIENAIGGLELAPHLAPGLVLRITAERRAVTDSLLSYAGMRDPRTGIVFGGVVRNRAHAQLEYTEGRTNLYLGAGYSLLTGQNVANNGEREAGAGGAYTVYRAGPDEGRVGLDLVYFGFDRNLYDFSLGQGGYFSPQSYVAALVPVGWQHKDDTLRWSLGVSAGYQQFTDRAEAVFPTDPAAQAALAGLAPSIPGLSAVYAGQTIAGLTALAHGEIEYQLTPTLRLGGRASYDRAGTWNEAQAVIYLRYLLAPDLHASDLHADAR